MADFNFSRDFNKSFGYDYKKDMGKEELLAAVGRFIAGQGNQAGTEALAEILVNIIENSAANSTDNFEQFDPTTSYVAGDIVRRGSGIYKFIVPHHGEWSDEDVEPTTIMDIIGDEVVRTHISAFEQSNLTAEQAVEAGFSADIIKSLWEKAHPTVKFIDQMVTFNAMEETTPELSIHSAVFYAAAKNKMYKAALYLYADGRLVYNVVEA